MTEYVFEMPMQAKGISAQDSIGMGMQEDKYQGRNRRGDRGRT